MSKVDPPPEPEEIEKRRKEIKWILDPKDVPSIDRKRLMDWGRTKMLAHEYLFKSSMPHNHTIASGDVMPEEIDVPALYKWKNLNWRIWKNNELFSITVKSGHKVLFQSDFAKIDRGK